MSLWSNLEIDGDTVIQHLSAARYSAIQANSMSSIQIQTSVIFRHNTALFLGGSLIDLSNCRHSMISGASFDANTGVSINVLQTDLSVVDSHFINGSDVQVKASYSSLMFERV